MPALMAPSPMTQTTFCFLPPRSRATAMPQGADAVAPPGQDLVRIGLVAHVPDELVVRRVEHLVQRDGELDYAEACAKVAAGHRDRVDGLLAKLRRKLRQVLVVQGAQLLWSAHPVKQRRCMFGALQIPGNKEIACEFAFL